MRVHKVLPCFRYHGVDAALSVVTKNKEYLSGAILPGIKISLEALSANAAQLSSVSIAKPDNAIGKDTHTNLQSGVYFGHLGSIKELKKVMLQEMNTIESSVVFIATGGFAHLFNEPGLFDVVVSDLVLQGIKIAFEKNK